MVTFFSISNNLNGKWNLDIDFLQVLTYGNILNFDSIENFEDS